MGLDMYLTKEICLWNKLDEPIEIKCKDGTTISITKDDMISKNIMYWSYLYDIADWFNDHVGISNEITGENLKKLIDFCKIEVENCDNEFHKNQYIKTINTLLSLDIDDYDWFRYTESY